jgi:hypothetical protein
MVELSGITIKLINEFTKILNENMPAIKTALAHVVAFIEGAFKDPHIIVANIKGLFQKLLGEMLDLATNSWWGRRIFGSKEDVENIQDRSKINFGQGISKTKYLELEAQEKAGKITAENKEVLADYRKTLMEAAAALARQEERGNIPLNKNSEQVKKEAEAIAKATYEAQNAGRSFDSLNEPAKNAKILEAMNRLEEKWAQGVANDRANIMSGKYTYEGLMEALNRKDYLNVEKRASGSPGGMPEDWGRESLVKLHGKEAVLTEDQLDSMKKSGGASIELEDLKIVAEGIITLNRQAAIQNQILTQMVDNQQRMIARSSGNRLMV